MKSRARTVAPVALFTLAATAALACGGKEAPLEIQTVTIPDAAAPIPAVDASAPPPVIDAGAPLQDAAPAEAAPPPCTATELAARLACIPGMTVTEVIDDPGTEQPRVPEGYRRFDLELEQPVNHDDPASPRFKQRLSLLHKSETAPMVLATSGYGLSTGRSEITRTFESNQIQVEHRFFTPSVPTPPTWEHLNIKQAAADYHHIVTALKPIYGGHWVNTGASKGGMTSVYHRRFYPSDLDGTVAYVAPNCYGTDDPRFVTFVQQAGGATYATCREKLTELQKAVLNRRAEMISQMQGTYTNLGSEAIALEHAVLELPFAFWQYTNPNDPQAGCSAIPAPTATASTIFRYFSRVAQLDNYSDDGFEYFSPYYYQAATQLGAPGVDDAPIASLLQHRATYSVAAYAPKNVPIQFDAAAMVDVATWVKTGGASLMFIYGENDPWTAGAFELGAARDSFVFVAAGKNHGANLKGLTAAEKQTALDALERWMGAKVTTPPSALPAPRDFVEGDDELTRRPRL